jgi:hypothetical protein
VVGPFEQAPVGVLGWPHVALPGEQRPEELHGRVRVGRHDMQHVASGAGHAGVGITRVRVLHRPGPDVGDERHAAAVQPVTQLHVLGTPAAEPLVEAADRRVIPGVHRDVHRPEEHPRQPQPAQIEPGPGQLLMTRVPERPVRVVALVHLLRGHPGKRLGRPGGGLVQVIAVGVADDSGPAGRRPGGRPVLGVAAQVADQQIRSGQRAAVQEHKDRRPGQRRAHIACPGDPEAPVFLVGVANCQLVAEGSHDLLAIVGRPVIGHDDLEWRRITLLDERGQRPAQQRRAIVGRHHHGQLRRPRLLC